MVPSFHTHAKLPSKNIQKIPKIFIYLVNKTGLLPSIQGDIEQKEGAIGFPYTEAEELVFFRNNNKGSRFNVNKHELVNCESNIKSY